MIGVKEVYKYVGVRVLLEFPLLIFFIVLLHLSVSPLAY